MISGFTIPNVVLSELNANINSPMISNAFNSANSSPSNLLIQPSVTILKIDSSSFPRSPRAMKTVTRISVNAIILMISSGAVMYFDTHSTAMFANLADAHMPAMMEMMEIA